MSRYVATCRLTSSARPSAIAYVLDTGDGKIVATRKHRHVSRRFGRSGASAPVKYGWTADGRVRVPSTVYARRCSERLLRKWLREHTEVT